MSALGILEHGALDFPDRRDTALDQDLAVEAERQSAAGSRTPPHCARDTPTDDPMLAGLTNSLRRSERR